MVSIEEARRQATQARQELSMFRTQVSQRETEISQAEKRIRGLQFPGDIRTQIALGSQPGIGRGGAGLELKRRRSELELQKQTGLGQIGIARQELRPSRIAIGERGQQITAFERQIDIATIRQSRQRRQAVASSRRGFQQRQARLKVFTGLGLEPVFGKIDVDGRTVRGITGLKSERLDTIFSFDPTGLASLGIEQPGSLKVLERAEIIDFAPSVTQIDLGQQFLPGIFIPSGGSTNVTSASNVTGNVSLAPGLFPGVFIPPRPPKGRQPSVSVGEPTTRTLPPPPSTLPPTGRPITIRELVGEERFPQEPAGTITIGDLIGFDKTVPGGGFSTILQPSVELLPPLKEFKGGGDIQNVQVPLPTLEPRPSLLERGVSRFASVASQIGVPSLIGIGPFGVRPPRQVEFQTGVTEAFIPSTKKEILITGITLGAGAAIGGGLKLGGFGLQAIGGVRAVQIGEGFVGAAGLGLGGLFAIETGRQVIAAPTPLEKGQVIGRVSREVTAIGVGTRIGTTGFTRVQDIIRTRGLTEIPAESVIAPEFFAGQRFPQIKKGQTAGELRKEFLEPVLPGEAPGVARGFTARVIPLPDVIPKGPLRFGELTGLFQAPKISPTFLRVAGEEPRLIGISGVLGGDRPLVARIQPRTLEFAPGVSPSQRAPAPFKFDPRQFSEQIAGTGRSIIPFLKTEKESVLAIETPVELTARRFFFKFEGRRIPIEEFKTTGTPDVITKPGVSIGGGRRGRVPTQTLESVISSSGIGRGAPIISPTFGITASLIRSSRFVSSGVRLSSGLGRPSRARRPSRPSRTSRVFSIGRPIISISPVPPSSSGFTPPSRIGGLGGFPRSSSLLIVPTGPITSITSPLIKSPRERKPKKQKKKRKGKRFVGKIAPSFTAQVLNIRGPLPKEIIIGGKEFGVLPGDIRRVPF